MKSTQHSRHFNEKWPPVATCKSHRGRMPYHAGLAAEDLIARHLAKNGYNLVAQRWRGKRGELDLVLAKGDALIFVEVKQSNNFDSALSHVTAAQIKRLYATVDEYLATVPNGTLIDIRFDVALVDGRGQIKVLENAFAHLF